MTPSNLIKQLRQVEVNGFPLVDKELKIWQYVIIGGKKIRRITSHPRRNGEIYVDRFPGTIWTKNEYKVLGTPPSMQRVMAFIWRKNSLSIVKTCCDYDLVELWYEIDPAGSHDFFWLIKNAGEHYEEVERFCLYFILLATIK